MIISDKVPGRHALIVLYPKLNLYELLGRAGANPTQPSSMHSDGLYIKYPPLTIV